MMAVGEDTGSSAGRIMSAISPCVKKATTIAQPTQTPIIEKPTASAPSSLPCISSSGRMQASSDSSSLFERSSTEPCNIQLPDSIRLSIRI